MARPGGQTGATRCLPSCGAALAAATRSSRGWRCGALQQRGPVVSALHIAGSPRNWHPPCPTPPHSRLLQPPSPPTRTSGCAVRQPTPSCARSSKGAVPAVAAKQQSPAAATCQQPTDGRLGCSTRAAASARHSTSPPSAPLTLHCGNFMVFSPACRTACGAPAPRRTAFCSAGAFPSLPPNAHILLSKQHSLLCCSWYLFLNASQPVGTGYREQAADLAHTLCVEQPFAVVDMGRSECWRVDKLLIGLGVAIRCHA